MTDIEVRKAKVVCHGCKEEVEVELIFGEDERYPDDFYTECPKCGHNESGALPLQYFDLLEMYDSEGNYMYGNGRVR